MLKTLLVVIFMVSLIIYEKFRRPIICKKKINKYIESLNGHIIDIKRLSIREETYLVEYKVKDEKFRITVKFNLFYKSLWY